MNVIFVKGIGMKIQKIDGFDIVSILVKIDVELGVN